MDVLAGTAASLRVDFTTATGSLIADPNSVAYSLYDSAATPIVGPVQVATQSTDTGVTIAIDASKNAIGGGRRFDKRLIIVSWTTGGQGHLTQANYRIVPVVPLTATATDVRAVIGCDIDELPDEEVDLFEAFLLIEADPGVGQAALAAALSSGTRVEQLANQAIVAQAVLELFSGMPQKMAMNHQSGTERFQRFGSLDPKPIVKQARDMRARGIAAIQGLVETIPALMTVTQSSDIVTDSSAVILSWP